jgi:hypothetical protein
VFPRAEHTSVAPELKEILPWPQRLNAPEFFATLRSTDVTIRLFSANGALKGPATRPLIRADTHHPSRPWRLERLRQIDHVFRPDRVLQDQHLHGIRVQVVDHTLMTRPHEAARDVRARPSKSDQTVLMWGRVLSDAREQGLAVPRRT